MSSTNADRQRKYKEKRRAKDLSLVQVWVPKDRIVEIKSIAAGMAEEGSRVRDLDLEPSQRQLNFAQFLCDKKGLKINQEVLSSSKKLSEWLNKNKRKSDKI
ncbi:MAG: hypothetical protein ACD_16C00121G0004 [uncultured bacterium]|nr:MAG: hypothetical protein ACD_16C00121G0004 [uncultured bacterium]HBG35377.1 hypothetical protein [Holosporales bacterium]HLE25496.1 hypothetical protein [Thermodesulfobacteriota bacterium]